MEEGTIKEEKKEDGILYFIAYKYDNVVLASHPVHRCTIVKEMQFHEYVTTIDEKLRIFGRLL